MKDFLYKLIDELGNINIDYNEYYDDGDDSYIYVKERLSNYMNNNTLISAKNVIKYKYYIGDNYLLYNFFIFNDIQMDLIQPIINLTYILNKLLGYRKNITFYIYLYHTKKETISDRYNIAEYKELKNKLMAFQIGGETYTCVNCDDVKIMTTREEECLFTLIHEMMHINENNQFVIKNKLSKHINDDNNSECVINFISICIYSAYVSYMRNSIITNIIMREYNHTFDLVSKYLLYVGTDIDNICDFINKEYNNYEIKSIIVRYYLLSNIFMYNFDKLFKFFDKFEDVLRSKYGDKFNDMIKSIIEEDLENDSEYIKKLRKTMIGIKGKYNKYNFNYTYYGNVI